MQELREWSGKESEKWSTGRKRQGSYLIRGKGRKLRRWRGRGSGGMKGKKKADTKFGPWRGEGGVTILIVLAVTLIFAVIITFIVTLMAWRLGEGISLSSE
jgi:hypothetical protein